MACTVCNSLSNRTPSVSREVITGYGTQNYWYHKEFACTVGQKWKLSFSTLANLNIRAYIYAVDQANVIIDDWYPGTDTSFTVSDYSLVVPSGAVKLIVLSGTSSSINAKLLTYAGIGNKKTVDSLTSKANFAISAINEMERSSFLGMKTTIPYTLTDNLKIVYNTNTTAVTTDTSIITFACEGKTQYELKGLLTGTNTGYAIHFYGSLGEVLGVISGVSNPSGVVTAFSPIGAVECKYTSWKNANYQGVSKFDFNIGKRNVIDTVAISFPTGVVPTFAKDLTVSTTIIITLPSINKMAVSSLASHDYLYTAETAKFTLLNNTMLVYNLTSRAMEIGTYADLVLGKTDKVVLAFNSYGKITHGKFKAYYDNQTLSAQITALENSFDNFGSAGIPDYYTTHLAQKISEAQLVQQAHVRGDNFVYITDLHVKDNEMQSPKLIGYLLDNLGIDKVFCGGDLVTAYGTKDEMFEMAYEGINALYSNINSRNAKLYMMRGNHDLTIKLSAVSSDGHTATRPETYNLFMRRQREYIMDNGDNLYYHYDNEKQKIRYICLDTCELNRVAEGTNTAWGVGYGVSQSQVDWLVNTALNIQEPGWTVIVFGHVSITPSIASFGGGNLPAINEVMKAIKNKTVATYSKNGIVLNKDFTTFLPEVVGYICGHNHKDLAITENGVLYISSTCDARYANDTIPRTAGTVSEGAFEIANLNTETNTLTLTRVGAGSSRAFTY